MKKNFFLTIVFVILIGIFSKKNFSELKSDTSWNRKNIMISKNVQKLYNSNEENIQIKISPSLPKIEIFKEEEITLLENKTREEEKRSSDIYKNKNSQNEKIENGSFKTADEVMDTLFPTLKNKVGENRYNEFITGFPYTIIKCIPQGLSQEQEKKYKELLEERRIDGNIHIPNDTFTTEEIFQVTNKLNRIYIPKFINILSKEQQEEFVKLLKNNFQIFK